MKDIIIKVLKTFIQAFIAVIVSYGVTDFESDSVLKGILIAAVASGIAAIMNIDYKSLEGEKEDINDDVNDEDVDEDAENEGGI